MSADPPPARGATAVRVGWVDHARTRLSRALQGSGLLALLLPFFVALFARVTGMLELLPLARAALPFGLFGGPLLAVTGALLARVRLATGSTLTLTDDELRVDGGRFPRAFRRARISGGVVSPTNGGATVEVELGGGDSLRVGVEGVERGEELLRALGVTERRVLVNVVDPRRRAWASLARGSLVILAGLMALGAAADALRAAGGKLPYWASLVWLLLMVAAMLGWQRRSRPAEVVLGTEGVRITDRRGPRLVPFAEIVSCSVEGSVLRLALEGGASEVIDAGTNGDPTVLEGLARLVRARLAVPALGTATERFERGERSVEDWRRELGELARQGAAYRQGDGEAAAERVLDDPTAPPDARVGAAVALVAGGEGGAARVRVAAAGVASEPLRLALERAAEGELEEEALAAALEERRGMGGG